MIISWELKRTKIEVDLTGPLKQEIIKDSLIRRLLYSKVTNFSTLFRVWAEIFSGNGKKILKRLFSVKKVLKNRG